MSVIVTLSGGKASAYCAKWTFDNFKKEDIILYFNDTRWEHKDLYRFLSELCIYFNHKLTIDSDGRNPEKLFNDNRALANNTMPFCSRILKAERLQKFYKDGDILIFGIGNDESYRANRLIGVYQKIAAKTNKFPKLLFPLITENIHKDTIEKWLKEIKIEEPILYKLGFTHNNCSGGCVRAGKKHWKILYEKLPEVYKERERVEEEIRSLTNKDIHFFKDETLRQFRERIENGNLSRFYEDDDGKECIGICDTIN